MLSCNEHARMIYSYSSIVNKYNKPKLISAIKDDILNEITTQPAKLNTSVNNGAPKNIILLDFLER
jgi:hypothetical protein